MEAVIRASDLDWTLVRATRLVNTPGTGRYRVRPDYPPPRGRKIARADVAHFIERALLDDDWVHAAPSLGYQSLRCVAIKLRYQAKDAFGVRRWVSKSTWTRPNRWS